MTKNRAIFSRQTKTLLAVPTIALALSIAACSGAVERPSVDDVYAGLAKAVESVGGNELYTEEAMQCIAEGFVGSALSDKDLAIVASGETPLPSSADRDLITRVSTELAEKCITP